MFFHEFGEDLVLALELLLQEGDLAILGVVGASGARFEGGRGVVEELLLPAVEHRGVDALLITEVRDGRAFEEVEPQDGDLLLGGEAFPGSLGHGRDSARSCRLFERLGCPISTEAEQRKRSTCSSSVWYCLFALTMSLPWPHKVSIGLNSGDRFGSHSSVIPSAACNDAF